MRIEAKDLQSAITQASIEFQCSVMDIDYTVIQYPKSGFLGLFKKNAIIEARSTKKAKAKSEKLKENKEVKEKQNKKNIEKVKNSHTNLHENSSTHSDSQVNLSQEKPKVEEFKKEPLVSNSNPDLESPKKEKYIVKSDAIFDSFHKESTETPLNRLDEIEIQVKNLIDSLGFDVKVVELKMQDKDNIWIKIDGQDSALLIGKNACRYKALSYLLHSWINSKYNLFIKLEISHFLENQTQMMKQYLQNIIEKIENTGRGQTKPLDGVLVKIALELLRERFPNKYVGIKQGEGDQKIIIVNDFLN